MSLPQLRSWDILRITAILISRFLLDLQEANRTDKDLNDGTSTQIISSTASVGTINFARVIGSIGASLDRPDGDGGSDPDGVEGRGWSDYDSMTSGELGEEEGTAWEVKLGEMQA